MLLTVVETPTFQKEAARIWSQADLHAFIDWVAAHPQAGVVIPGSDGARKLRWSIPGKGKRGGARVIYFHRATDAVVLLVTVYEKSAKANISAGQIQRNRT